MNKLAIAILIISATTILAERPDWYPENAREIEEKCRNDNSISPDIMAQILTFKLEDTPNIRSFLFCSANEKSIYSSGGVFNPERLQYALKDTVKMDCQVELIRDCDEKNKKIQPEDFRYYSILKCVAVNRVGKCERIA